MITYKDDDSFFTTVFPPFIHHGLLIKQWLTRNENSKFRYIRDKEIEDYFYNVEQINEIYPGIKTIGMVLNPWNRISYAYRTLSYMKETGFNNYSINFDFLKLDTFTKFVESLNSSAVVEPFTFSLSESQHSWFNRGELKATYVLRAEFIEEDFKEIKEYFCSDTPLVNKTMLELSNLTLPEYKEYYTDYTKAIVAQVFKEDIEQYGYEF